MGGLESLGINLPTLIAQLVNVIILFGLLYLVAYKPIMRMLDERSRRVKESMEQTEQIKQQAEHAEEEAAKKIADASKEGEEVIARAMKTGEEVKKDRKPRPCWRGRGLRFSKSVTKPSASCARSSPT
jgi:F-type H+-transporting ATPase subunit b